MERNSEQLMWQQTSIVILYKFSAKFIRRETIVSKIKVNNRIKVETKILQKYLKLELRAVS